MSSNILIDSLPVTITVAGGEIPIQSDFRTSILFELLILDRSVPDNEKLLLMLNLFIDGNTVKNEDIGETIDQILLFYRCGKEPPKKRKTKNNETARPVTRIYDFDFDDAYIFAAFLTQYGIDLNDIDYMHWWKFNALFRALKQDNEIVKIMEYRATDLSKIKNKDEKARMAKLKAIHALPDGMTLEEKAARAGAMFGGV